ncbi:MAG: hypothetical protein ACXWZM_06960 [Solirubrobacterales bacterium]
MAPPASTSISERTLRLGLALAGLGAVLVLVNLFGLPGRLVGLGAIVAGVVISAPHADSGGPIGRWWDVLAAGALITLAGVALSFAIDSLGGLLSACGGILVAIAVVLGFPA